MPYLAYFILCFAVGLCVGTLTRRSAVRRVADEAYDRGYDVGFQVGVIEMAHEVISLDSDDKADRDRAKEMAERN
jgi:hypothetical protein